MDLWESVCTTDPNATKKVNQRGGFTAIDAYSQIMAATGQFGPVGEGWGWGIVDFQYPPNDTVIVHLRMWHGQRDNTFDVCGQSHTHTLGKDPKPDADCAKKAVTDAITKGLSYLGFNADVFLGKFDDNKYVESLHEKNKKQGDLDGGEAWGGPLGKTEFKNAMQKFDADLNACTETTEFEALMVSAKTLTDQCQRCAPTWWESKAGSDVKGFKDRIDTVRANLEENARVYADAGLAPDGGMMP